MALFESYERRIGQITPVLEQYGMKTIEQIVSDGIYEKTHNMTAESMGKIGDTLEKVMNENSGLVCLIV